VIIIVILEMQNHINNKLHCIVNPLITPVVKLNTSSQSQNVYAKLEKYNPSGSHKDRSATLIINHGIETGIINSSTVIIESSSGNFGISLAKICNELGLRFICVTDINITKENYFVLSSYKAEIISLNYKVDGYYLKARISKVKELLNIHSNSFWPNQYENPIIPSAYYPMMDEICNQINDDINYLFCPISTCATIYGIQQYCLKHEMHKTKMIAVDSVGSNIYGNGYTPRLIPGLGAGIKSVYANQLKPYDVVMVTDEECIQGCLKLQNEYNCLVGGSSGGTFIAYLTYLNNIQKDETTILIFPDDGARYRELIFNGHY
jgi:N-(2-amino-2-carboxyethyl)-L-glutamate synthase